MDNSCQQNQGNVNYLPPSQSNTSPLINDKINIGNASIGSSVLNLILSIIGAGTLAIPYAVSQVGYCIAAILFISIAIISILTLNLNMICAKEIIPLSSFHALSNYTLPKLRYFVDITVICATFGVLCVYLVVIGNLLPDVIETIFNKNKDDISPLLINRRLWITIYLLIFIIPTARLKKMNHLRYTSLFAILCYGYILTIVIIYALDKNLDPCRKNDDNCFGEKEILPSNYFKIFKALPFFVQIYSCHFNTFSICNELKNPTISRLNIVATLSIFISMIIYTLIGFGAYYTFGNNIQSNVIMKYPQSTSLLILRIILSIAIAFGYPVIMQSPRDCLSGLLFKEKTIDKLTNLKFYFLTYCIVLFSFCIAMITDNIGQIFSIIGSTTTITLVFILPGLFYYNFNFQQTEKRNKYKKCFSLLCIIIGIILIPFCIAITFLVHTN